MDLQALKAIGLTDVEAKIYATLLELGASTSGTLSKKTKIHRRTVYDAMERLIEKGLVGFMKRNEKRYYLAVNPKRLLEIVEKEEDELQSILPALEQRFAGSKTEEKIMLLEGRKGLKQALKDQLTSKTDIFIMGDIGEFGEWIGPYFQHFRQAIQRSNIQYRFLANETDRRAHTFPNSSFRYLPRQYTSPSIITVYDNKVIMTVRAQSPIILLIENSTIAESYRNNFEFLWKKAKP
ncbi:hypothetical protein HY488_00435 [Candidatus Woesearchaeota archaeon]|nr:hypothetical protein [Candidatus Woesearchaeota archaeon]